MTLRTFLENNESSIGSSGAAWDSCDALRQINRVRSAFYDIGDWDGNTSFICITCCNGKIYLPFYASKIISAFKCNKQVLIADSEFFALVSRSCCGTQVGIVDNNQYSPVPRENCFSGNLLFQAMDTADKGVEITASYLNRAGSMISDSIILDPAWDKISSAYDVMTIKALSKPSTHGPILVYDCAGTCLFGLSPYSTSYQYRVYCLQQDCCDDEQIVLHVAKAFYPFTELHYDHLIDFPEHALSLGMEAISARSLRTTEGIAVYEKLFRLAIQYLKKQKEIAIETLKMPENNLLNYTSLVDQVTYGDD